MVRDKTLRSILGNLPFRYRVGVNFSLVVKINKFGIFVSSGYRLHIATLRYGIGASVKIQCVEPSRLAYLD